jgi:hypothetical protein
MPATSLPADHLHPGAIDPTDDLEDDCCGDDMDYDPPIHMTIEMSGQRVPRTGLSKR